MDLQDGKRMFGDIKSKLGFGKSQDQGYDDGYDDGYDEFAEYGDGYDEYAEDYGDGYDAGYDSGSSYNSYAPVTTRAASSRTGTSSSSMPRLVSIDDVRASTQVPSSLNRDPLPARHVTSAGSTSRSFGRTMVDSSLPPEMTPEGTAAVSAAASRRRSEGLDSLFTPTTGPDAAGEDRREATSHASSASSPRTSGEGGSSAVAPQGSYDPYEAYSSGGSSSSFSSRRTVVVLKPASYGEVERVSKALKGGDAVVLALRNTPDSLAKRILDFSFGVASALDATVECVGDKVFAVVRGNALSEVERMNLRNQGVL